MARKVREVSSRALAGTLRRPRGRSELVLERLAQLLRGLGHVLTLSMGVHLRARRMLHRRIRSPHGIAAAEFGPRDPHTLNVAQPRLHVSLPWEESSDARL